MYATLTITEISTALVVFEKNKKGGFEEKLSKTYPAVISLLNSSEALANFLIEIATETKTEQAIWLVGLPISIMSFHVIKINSNMIDEDIMEHLLRYSDIQEKEKKQLAVVQKYLENEVAGYYTVAAVNKEVVQNILLSFRVAELDIFVIEPRITSMCRFFNHIFDIQSNEITYIDESTNALLVNKFGVLVYKQATEGYMEIALQTLKQSARDKFPNITLTELDFSAVAYLDEYPPDIPLPTQVLFHNKFDSPYVAICASGLILKYLKMKNKGGA